VKGEKLKNGKNLEIKIGIHTGPIIAGVVGDHKKQFSLIGQTINYSSRLCSTGEKNEIHMSKAAWECLRKHTNLYTQRERQTFMKGIGENVTTFIISKKKEVFKKAKPQQKGRASNMRINVPVGRF